VHSKLSAVLSSLVLPLRGEDRFFPGVNPKSVTTQWRRATACAGCPWFRFHDLRHYVASTMANNGASVFAVSQWMGHRDIKTTQVYLHAEKRILEAAAQAFDKPSHQNTVGKLLASGENRD